MPLKCRTCSSTNHLEFGTEDGDEPKSVILCARCAGRVKAYIIRRGYDIEFNEYFGPLERCECGCQDVESLRNEGDDARTVMCIACKK